MQDIGADFYGFSFYKFFGPHCAAIAANPSLLNTLENEKLLPATSVVPERFELGTLPYELMAGCTAAIDYVANLSEIESDNRREKILDAMAQLEAYEHELFTFMENETMAIPGITLYGHAKNRTPTMYFNLKGLAAMDVYKQLATLRINAPAGNFYALEASRALGLEDNGAVRAGLAPYSTMDELIRLLDGLRGIAK